MESGWSSLGAAIFDQALGSAAADVTAMSSVSSGAVGSIFIEL
jgi:hypothetical protein